MIELLLWLCLFSILMTVCLSILTDVNKILARGHEQDEILLNGRYGIEYIKDEILSADKIISASKIDGLNYMYPKNIGFVIQTREFERNGKGEITKTNYNYSTYYQKGHELVRISTNKTSTGYPTANSLLGFNYVCEYVIDISETRINRQNKIINLKISMGYENNEDMSFKSTLALNCPIDI